MPVDSALVLGSTATLGMMTLGDTSEVYVKGNDESDIASYLGTNPPGSKLSESFRDKTFTGQGDEDSHEGVEKDKVTTLRCALDQQSRGVKAMRRPMRDHSRRHTRGRLQIRKARHLRTRAKKAAVEVPDPKAKEGQSGNSR